MKPGNHIIISIGVSIGLYLYFHSFLAALVSFISGVFIDIDHILDYILHGKISLHLVDYYLFSLEKQFSKIFLFFHSFEVIILFWIVITIYKSNIYWICFAVGLTQHLILDCIDNSLKVSIKPFSYFLIYRAIKGFRRELLFKEI